MHPNGGMLAVGHALARGSFNFLRHKVLVLSTSELQMLVASTCGSPDRTP